MKLSCGRSGPGMRERGFAMIAILALAALMASYLIASALTPTAPGLASEYEQRNMSALRQAKAALIAYAANEQWQRYKDPTTANQPGALPCPDGNNDGNSDGICPSALLRIGRLPYKTIDSPDLTDARGERLWYAVSSNFYKNSSNIVNSDTPGLLTVTGIAPVSDVVAIVFAPGPPVQDPTLPGQVQDRSAANLNRLASYLEGYTVASPDYVFNVPGALPSNTYNDRLIVITQAELMAAVEPVVAARIMRDIRPEITQNYFSANGWSGRYPFAVSWTGVPSSTQNAYKGDAAGSTHRGLMPISREASPWLAFSTPSVSMTQIPGAGTGGYLSGALNIGPVDCSASTWFQISCTFNYPGGGSDRVNIRVQATIIGAARAFIKPYPTGDEYTVDAFGSTPGFSNTISPNPWTISNTLLASGDGTIVFGARVINAATMGNQATIEVPLSSFLRISDPADTVTGWFVANKWYRQTYYAISNGGGASCTTGVPPPTGTQCLTVNNLATSPMNDKRLILVFGGRALGGQDRTTGNLSAYFELENNTPADLIFQHHRLGLPTTINDRVVVVAP